MRIYDCARRYMRRHGNMSQWIAGYPSRETVTADIAHGCSFVGIGPDGRIVMAFALIFGPDPTYAHIEQGAWRHSRPYATIHRLGSDGSCHAVLRSCIAYAFSLYDSLRLDTHADNLTMRNGVEKLGFTPSGIIYCDDGSPRIAYECLRQDALIRL